MTRLVCPVLMVVAVAFAAPAAPASVFVVTNTNDSGPGSLRQAILNANQTAAADVVTFNIPGRPVGGGTHVIHLSTALPAVIQPLVIDGTTEPDYVDVPVVELDGTNAGQALGFYLKAQGCGVRGLAIEYFASAGVWMSSDNQFVERCSFEENHQGVLIHRVHGCVVRNNEFVENYYAGLQAVAGGGHLVEGNTVEECWRGIIAYNSADNLIQGNEVEPNEAEGIYVIGAGAFNNYIGRNVVKGNWGNGIYVAVSAAGTVVEGNEVGRNLSGIVASDAVDITIGGNTVVRNQKTGIVLGTNGAIVNANYVGEHSLGGVRIVQGDNNLLNDNTIVDNPGDGVYVYGNHNTGTGNTITGNGRNVFIAGGVGNQNK